MHLPSTGVPVGICHEHEVCLTSCCVLGYAGNDFSTLYAPLIRDGRMEKYYWNVRPLPWASSCTPAHGCVITANKIFEL